MSLYSSGILMTNGFSVAGQKPADLKFLADTISDRDKYVTDNLAYEGMLVYVKATQKTYQYLNNSWEEFGFNQDKFEKNLYNGLDSDSATTALTAKQGKVLNDKLNTHTSNNTIHITAAERTTWNAKASTVIATQTANGLMSKEDKSKLDGIAENANNYVHPSTHPATMIVEDTTHRFSTDSEKATWNAKATTATVTVKSNGLMSADDKNKLDGIEENANNYVHPNDANTRHVSDTEKAMWNAKATTATATQTTNGLMSYSDKAKLDNISSGANAYVHPNSHPATMIVEDTTHRFVTDTEKSTWNAKATTATVTQTTNGLMSLEDKKKLDGIAENANKYIHPNDSNTRHVSDSQISNWNAKATTAIVTQTANGLMSAVDKKKLDGIASGANNYVHPNDANTRHVTDTQISAWNAKATTAIVTTESNGLMSKEDKSKLDGIANNANNYVHPDKHPATMITEDTTHRFSTDSEKATWNAKANTTTVTTESNGLMSAADKKKLDSISSGANSYVHPATHPATMIVEDSTHRFVTDTEKTTWNGITALIDKVNKLETAQNEMLAKLKTAVFWDNK